MFILVYYVKQFLTTIKVVAANALAESHWCSPWRENNAGVKIVVWYTRRRKGTSCLSTENAASNIFAVKKVRFVTERQKTSAFRTTWIPAAELPRLLTNSCYSPRPARITCSFDNWPSNCNHSTVTFSTSFTPQSATKNINIVLIVTDRTRASWWWWWWRRTWAWARNCNSLSDLNVVGIADSI